MTRVGIALAMLVGVLAFGVLSGASQRDLLRALDAVGCRGAPAAEYQELAARVVLSVSVHECVARGIGHDRDVGLARDEALARMSDAIWSTPTYRFDSLFVTVYRTAEEPHRTRANSEELSREQLVAEYGPRDPALDHAPALVDGEGMAWRIIPMLAAGAALLLLRGLWLAVRDGRVVPVWIVGRAR
jgi:hypothetical protein